ncbi:MAG: YgfZ/GcvT domain-containing protein [Gammaproteobacteria bacterium]
MKPEQQTVRETLTRPGLAALTDRSVIRVTGADATDFLHAQFISDIQNMPPGSAGLSAWCNPKGRSICNFVIAFDGTAYTLVLPRALHRAFCQRLQMFILRAEVTVEDKLDELACTGLLYDDQALPDNAAIPEVAKNHCVEHQGILAMAYLDGCSLLLSEVARAQTLREDLAATLAVYQQAQWTWMEIRQRCPWLDEATTETFIPQEMSLDEFGIMSFDKGCYPGQEIIARIHYRGEVKRRLHYASCDTDTPIPSGGKVIDNAGNKAGVIVTAVRTDKTQRLLCVIDARYAQDQVLHIDGMDKTIVTLH